MNVDSRDGREDYSLEGVRRQLRALSRVEPPSRLRERLLGAVPQQTTRDVSPPRMRGWLGARSWVGIAATVAVLGSVLWLRLPTGPTTGPQADANSGLRQVLASDYNSVRPPDINALDSNSF